MAGGTGTLTVTPDTGAGAVTINTLPASGQTSAAQSLPATLDTGVQTAPGTAGTATIGIQGNPAGLPVGVDTVIRSPSTNRGTVLPVGATSASVGSGGTGNVVGDVLTVAGGTLTPANAAQGIAAGAAAQFTVSAVSSGAVTAVTLKTAGSYVALPSSPAATTSSGSGTGCTLAVVFAGIAIQIAAANAARRGLEYQPQGGIAYVSGLASATADQNSLKLPADVEYETPPHRVGTGAISAIAGGAVPVPLYAREF